MLPDRLKLSLIKQSGKQFNSVKSQLNRNDVNEIIIATDAGREGDPPGSHVYLLIQFYCQL